MHILGLHPGDTNSEIVRDKEGQVICFDAYSHLRTTALSVLKQLAKLPSRVKSEIL